jgi:hypothetical protein
MALKVFLPNERQLVKIKPSVKIWFDFFCKLIVGKKIS